ncbi:hypothetical protein JCM8097_007372 [Rhodosporidiobolus ruineniae]
MLSPLVALPLLPLVLAGSSATYSLSNLPHTSEAGQTGYNDCGSTDSQSSMCQTVQVNSVTDFCLWAPPTAGPEIGESEEYEVAWCTATGHGARVMPAGTIQSAHYLETPHYIQITGTGDFTKINVKAGDQGGELDPHGATGLGNPIGSLVFANGVQMHEWHSFISDTEYCIRVCKDSDDAWLWCEWVDPGNYGSGFDSCEGAGTVNPPGIYTGSDGKRSTFNQGDGHTPTAMAPGASSNCQAVATVGGAGAAVAAPASSSAAASSVSSAVSSASSAVSTGESSASSAVSSGMSTSFVPSSGVPSSGAESSTSSLPSSSSSVLSSASSGLSSSASVSASNPSSSVVTVTSTSSASSATLPVTTAGQQAAASASNKPSSGASSLAVSAVGSLVAVAGAIAFFA